MTRSSVPVRRAPIRTFLCVLVTASLAGIAASAGSAAERPCGEVMVDDWFDNGRVDRIYDLECYEDALEAIPSDLRDYTDAEDVFSRALQAAALGRLAQGGDDPTPGNPPSEVPDTPPPGPPKSTGDRIVAPEVEETASAVPLPLVLLASMSLVLLAAGGVGYLSRRPRDSSQEQPPEGTAS